MKFLSIFRKINCPSKGSHACLFAFLPRCAVDVRHDAALRQRNVMYAASAYPVRQVIQHSHMVHEFLTFNSPMPWPLSSINKYCVVYLGHRLVFFRFQIKHWQLFAFALYANCFLCHIFTSFTQQRQAFQLLPVNPDTRMSGSKTQLKVKVHSHSWIEGDSQAAKRICPIKLALVARGLHTNNRRPITMGNTAGKKEKNTGKCFSAEYKYWSLSMALLNSWKIPIKFMKNWTDSVQDRLVRIAFLETSIITQSHVSIASRSTKLLNLLNVL